MKLYLIQTGKFISNNEIKTYRTPERMNIFGRRGLIHLNYMGAAEFEWGSIPTSGLRIAKEYKKGNFVLKDSGLKTIDEMPMYIFCNKDIFDDAITEIKAYLDDRSKVDQISKYRTKEPIHLEYSMLEWYFKSNLKPREIPNFWWDIEHDFMFFVGAEDRRRLFSFCIDTYCNTIIAVNAKEDI